MSDDGDHPKTRAIAASVAINNCRCRKGHGDGAICRASSLFPFDVGRIRGRIRLLDRIDLRLEVGGPRDQGGGEFRIRCGFGELEQRRRLTREIKTSQHPVHPNQFRHSNHAQAPDSVPARNIKNSGEWFRPGARRNSAPVEGKPDELLLPPDHAAGLVQSLAWDDEYKMVGKPEGSVDLDACAHRRKAADDAGDGFAAELDRSGFQDAVARCNAAFFHEGTERSGGVVRSPTLATEVEPGVTGLHSRSPRKEKGNRESVVVPRLGAGSGKDTETDLCSPSYLFGWRKRSQTSSRRRTALPPARAAGPFLP